MGIVSTATTIAAMLAFSASSQAIDGARQRTPTAPLNDTGMLKCADPSGNFGWDCAGTGQDAAYGRDVDHPSEKDGRLGFSFTKVCNSGQEAGSGTCSSKAVQGSGPDDWGCVKDNVTGLIWEEKTAVQGLHYYYTYFSPASNNDNLTPWVKSVNAAGLCGAKDWRLPSARELQGILNTIVTFGPLVDLNAFPNTLATGYWLNTPDYWKVTFDGGVIYPDDDPYEDIGPARLVRGGVADPVPRFKSKADEVVDLATGLIWRRCSEGQAWDGATCNGTAASAGWQDALTHALSEAARTGEGWRLPNVKELESLVVFQGSRSSIDSAEFPRTSNLPYWTSTPYEGTYRGYPYTPAVFSVSLVSGGVSYSSFSAATVSRLVRDAGR